MTIDEWREAHPVLTRMLSERLGNAESCTDVVGHAEVLMGSLWRFMATFIGEGGSRAVVARALKLARPRAPILGKLEVDERGVDFGALRGYAADPECQTAEALNALLLLNATIFDLLAQLAGDTLIEPILRHLEK